MHLYSVSLDAGHGPILVAAEGMCQVLPPLSPECGKILECKGGTLRVTAPYSVLYPEETRTWHMYI